MAINMEVPDEEEIKKEVQEQVKPVPKDVARIQSLVDGNIADIMSVNIDDFAQKKEIKRKIESFGADSINRSTHKNTLLQVMVGSLAKDSDESSIVAKSLLDLRREITKLDPSGVKFIVPVFLGPLVKSIRDYFDKYRKADEIIADIVDSLEKGKKILDRDITTLELEKHEMRELTKKQMKEAKLGDLMVKSIEKQIEEAKGRNEDPEKIKFVEEEILHPLMTRLMDINQMIAVNQQGIVATEFVIRNNRQLIQGVTRAQTVTVSALKIAVMVASSLYNQKIVMEKLDAIANATEWLIVKNADNLHLQGKEIRERSGKPAISVEKMKMALDNVIKEMEAISNFKQIALPKMIVLLDQYKELVDRGEEQIKQLECGNTGIVAEES